MNCVKEELERGGRGREDKKKGFSRRKMKARGNGEKGNEGEEEGKARGRKRRR